MRGYTSPLANSARTSWVSALPRQYGPLQPAVSASLSAALGAPVAVAVDSASGHALYHFRHGVIIERGREQTGLPTAPGRDAMAVALPQGAVVGDALHGWDTGESGLLDPGAPVGRMLVAGVVDEAWITVRQNIADTTVDAITIRRTPLHAPPHPQSRVDAGFGCAAISQTGLIGMALNHGAFVVINPASLHERFELRRHPAPYLVSALPSGWALVSAVEATDAKTPPVEQRARALGVPGYQIRGSWRSLVERLSEDGTTRWSVELPFPILQPPVDGGEPRCYLVGKGLAAVDGGRVVWSKPANVRLMASCFGNGVLALASGFMVRIIGRDGRVLQTVTVPDRSRIVTLPTIGPDGAIYVGTITGFWVAR